MSGSVADPGPGLGPADTVSYIRVYTDDDDITRFEDLDYALAPVEFAPPAPPVLVTSASSASAVVFLRFPQGWTDPAHPAPARQFAFLLSGEAIVTAGGEERRIRTGDIGLLEDTHGPGHGLTALTDVLMAIVRL